MKGTVYSGINNIYSIKDEQDLFHQCRIKGKILSNNELVYNPLAPGDLVEFTETEEDRGLITSLCERRNRFARWNKKKDRWQIVAANLDYLIVVLSRKSPPFRPRFVDRVLINAEFCSIPVMILINKYDLHSDDDIEERIRAWRNLGIPVLKCSAKEAKGLDELHDFLRDRMVVLFGQSGVGKSTLINTLIQGLDLPTGSISEKYDRGRHVTNFGRMIDAPWNGQIVDTPGIREIPIYGISPSELPQYFPEILSAGADCDFQPCTHCHEPGCAVIAALERGEIHPDRYENYTRIHQEICLP